MKKPIVFDSFALLSFFHKEEGWEKVKDILRRLVSEDKKGLLSRINWGEFYYIIRRRVGRVKAEEALALLEQLPIEILPVDDQIVKEAAEIKAGYPVAFADAFCVALARRVQGCVITGDPEFKSVEGLIAIEWL